MTDRLRWDESLTQGSRDPGLLRDPLRLAVVAGTIVFIVGALLPWAEGMIGFLPVFYGGGLDPTADGFFLAIVGAVLLFFVRDHGFVEATDGPKRWAPMLIALAGVVLWLVGSQSSATAIRRWEGDDGTGSLALGYWIAGAGVVTAAVAATIAAVRRRPGEGPIRLPHPRLPGRGDVEGVLGAVGAVVGAVAGAVGALALFDPISVIVPLLFFGTLGLIFGQFAGQSIGARLRPRG